MNSGSWIIPLPIKIVAGLEVEAALRPHRLVTLIGVGVRVLTSATPYRCEPVHDEPPAETSKHQFVSSASAKFRNDRWVFGDPGSDAYLIKFSWTDIVRHVMVQGAASPDDPALADYWAKRRRKVKPPLDNYTMRLLARQHARCPICGDHLLSADQPPQSPDDWERWWLGVTRQAIAADYLVHHGRPGPPQNDPTRLVHAASCRRGLHARQGGKPAPPRAPSRLA